jgi:hypothetical protein
MYGEMYSAGDVIGLLLHMPTAWVAELYRGKAKTIAQAVALARKPPPAEKEKSGEEAPTEEDLQMKVGAWGSWQGVTGAWGPNMTNRSWTSMPFTDEGQGRVAIGQTVPLARKERVGGYGGK